MSTMFLSAKNKYEGDLKDVLERDINTVFPL
jgi:hypothetical protein